MISPCDYDIVIPQRATFSQQFQLRDEAGEPLDMSDHSLSAQIWTPGKTVKLADFDVEWIDQAEGHFRLVLPISITQNFVADGYWDLLVTNPDGTKDYWLRGAATLNVGYTE